MSTSEPAAPMPFTERLTVLVPRPAKRSWWRTSRPQRPGVPSTVKVEAIGFPL
jgi:hypothetical protein